MQTSSNNLSEYSSQPNEEIVNREVRTSQMMESFEEQLKNMFWTERTLIKALPKMISFTTSDDLILVLMDHIQQSHEQVMRLATAFRTMGIKPALVKCEAIEVFINQASDVIKDCGKSHKCDAGIIAATQNIAQHKLSVYEMLRNNAKTLGLSETEALLVKIYKAEQEAYQELKEVATEVMNTIGDTAKA